WDIATGKQSQSIELPGDATNTLLAGPNRAVVRDETSVRLWDLTTGKQTLKLEAAGGVGINPFTGLPGQISLAADGKTLVVTTSDQAVHAYNLETGKQLNGEKDLQFGDNQGRKVLYAVGASPDC